MGVEPQNPPFAFPERAALVPGLSYLAVADDAGDMVKDDNGPIILMGYSGLTPGGMTSTGLWVVAHDTPTRIHPGGKYVYQKYRATTCRKCDTPMQPGIAVAPTLIEGAPDFPGDTHGITLNPGPGVFVPCMKCPACGWSVT